MKKILVLCLTAMLFITPVFAEEIKQFAYYENAYPHCAVYEVTNQETGTVSYQVNTQEKAPWDSRFMPYRWETKYPYFIWDKRFTNLPDAGWVEQNVYPQMNVTENDIFRLGMLEPVEKHYQPFGYYGIRIVGENRVADGKKAFATYPGKIPVPDWDLLTPENLSRMDSTGKYLVSDEQIAAQFPLFDSAYLTGRNYAKGTTLTIDAAQEIMDGADPGRFDPSVLQPSWKERSVSWQLRSENEPPYRQYEVLCLDSILLDGRKENGVILPNIYRYNGKYGEVAETVSTYRSARIYVFTYHWISEDPLNWGDYTITKKQFRDDIRYLYENGFHFTTMSELYQMNGTYPAEKIALITFDDGYASCYTEALPVLEQYGAKATMFVVGSYLDTQDYLTKDQLLKLSESPLVEIGNHSYEIHNLPKEDVLALYRKDVDTALADYYQNEELIYQITSKRPTALSFPYGAYTKNLERFLKEHGYEITVSTYAANNHNTKLKAPLNRLNRSYYTTPEMLIQEFQ